MCSSLKYKVRKLLNRKVNKCTCIYASIKPSGCIAFPYMSGKVIQHPGVSRATLHMHLKIAARIYKDIHTHLERPMHV